MEELKAKLLDEIERTGFPSELKAARVFAARGHTVDQNEHYIDYDENNGREIDLSVILSASSRDSGLVYTVLDFVFAEVKRSKSKPLVVFTSEAIWSDFTEQSIMHAATYQEHYKLTREDLFGTHPAKSKARIGRTAYQAFRRSENTEPHIWVLGTLKAAKYLKIRAGEITRESRKRRVAPEKDPGWFANLSLATPLVILDGLLYEAYLVGDAVEVHQQQHLVYSCHYGSRAYPGARHLVDIVTLDYLNQYLDEHQAWLQRMADFMRNHPQILPTPA